MCDDACCDFSGQEISRRQLTAVFDTQTCLFTIFPNISTTIRGSQFWENREKAGLWVSCRRLVFPNLRLGGIILENETSGSGVSFRGTLRECEYSISATTPRKMPRKDTHPTRCFVFQNLRLGGWGKSASKTHSEMWRLQVEFDNNITAQAARTHAPLTRLAPF